MIDPVDAGERDRWAAWLLERRDGGDAEAARRSEAYLARIRDDVLDGADVHRGDVVLDLGAGTGLIAFGALQRVGEDGQVIFTDVSDQLLAECRRRAIEIGVADRCRFLNASADALSLSSCSVDVVTSRSVLIYLDDKLPAFQEAHRVLRPGGRLSVFEPINSFGYPEPDDRFLGFDVAPVRHLADKVRVAASPRERHPLLTFDERDLFRWAEQAGFSRVRMIYTAEVRPWELHTSDWDVLLAMAPNPLDPTLGEQLIGALSPHELTEFEAHLRPLVEGGGERRGRSATVLMTAVKPG